MKLKGNKQSERHNTFGIKKFKVGVVSVLIACSFIISGGVALASDTVEEGESSTSRVAVDKTEKDNGKETKQGVVEGDNNLENKVTASENSVATESTTVRKKRDIENNYNGTVTFVTNNGNTDVKFTNKDEKLDHTDADGNSANTSDTGGGFSKAYFQGFSNIPNYTGRSDGIMVYKNESIETLFPNGIKGGEKVYAVYLSAISALSPSNLTGKLEVNKNTTVEKTVYNDMDVKNTDGAGDKKATTYYVDGNLNDKQNLNLGASFTLNPFTTAVVRYSPSHYFQPGTTEYYPTTDSTKLNDPANKEYTYVDLHVQFDKRIKLANELDFFLKSYSFQPHMVLDKNNNKIDANFEVTKDNPNSHITFKTESLVDNEFVLRTRIRRIENMQENVPLAIAASDMELISNKEDNFSISKEEILKIAKQEAKPLEIGGYVDGWVKLYSIWGFGGPRSLPKTEGKIMELNFEFNKVDFNKNTTQYNDASEQNLGKVNVEHKGAIQTDGLNTNTKPTNSVVGDTMPNNPANIEVDGNKYRFKEWNTKADGTGITFTGETKVTEDLTVYAIWIKQINVDFDTQGGQPSKVDRQVIDSGTVATKPSDPIKEDFVFVGWAKQGETTIFDYSTELTEDTLLVAQWKENEYKVTYEFESITPGKMLPDEVLNLLPSDSVVYKKGNKIKPTTPSQIRVVEGNGEWIFRGYDKSEVTVGNFDIKFIGNWEYKEKQPTPEPQPTPEQQPTKEPHPRTKQNPSKKQHKSRKKTTSQK